MTSAGDKMGLSRVHESPCGRSAVMIQVARNTRFLLQPHAQQPSFHKPERLLPAHSPARAGLCFVFFVIVRL